MKHHLVKGSGSFWFRLFCLFSGHLIISNILDFPALDIQCLFTRGFQGEFPPVKSNLPGVKWSVYIYIYTVTHYGFAMIQQNRIIQNEHLKIKFGSLNPQLDWNKLMKTVSVLGVGRVKDTSSARTGRTTSFHGILLSFDPVRYHSGMCEYPSFWHKDMWMYQFQEVLLP